MDNPPCRVSRAKLPNVLCPHCNVQFQRKNIKKHIYRQHTDKAVRDITANSHLDAVCIDEKNGIYAVKKSFLGPFMPLHVQKKTWGKEHQIKCESGLKTFLCHHVRSLDYCSANATDTVLSEETLTDMVENKWFGENRKRQCLQLQSQAATASVPVSVNVTLKSELKRYISVYEPNVSYYSRLGRVVVIYNKTMNNWHCPSSEPRMSCIHKYVAKWHLFETQRHLFRKVRSTERTSETTEHELLSENTGITYPPEDDRLKKMVSYIYSSKKYPCPGNIVLGPQVLITSQAQIVSLTGVLKGLSTYCKECGQCGMLYRYQEYKDGLHNFDDGVTILTFNLCMFLRNSLQAHTAVGRVFDALEETLKTALPSRDQLLHAYLHFEALTAHEYKYSCVNCGNFPPLVVMDLHKKGVFSMPFSDIEPVPEDFTGEVNVEDFWDSVSLEMIARGLTSSKCNRKNPFTVHPSTRRSNTVLNTEFLKAQGPRNSAEADDINITEDRLSNELMNLKVDAVRTLCKECDPCGSKIDLILRLRTEMQNRQAYDKVFQKIWGASGGLAAIMCPCGVLYSLKFNIRAEGPRDFADMLLSWKHMPNISVYDFARGLVNHTNVRVPENPPFQPNEGRLAPPTPENIQAAKNRTLKTHLPWLLEPNTENFEHDSHPVTKSSQHYVLCDKLHEGNSKDEKDILRRIEHVPELAGQLNSQVAEQFFAKMRKNNYFINNMSPSAHIFLVRNIVHHHNGWREERQTIEKMKRNVRNVSITLDTLGKAVAGNISITVLKYVLDPKRNPDETIIRAQFTKVQQVTLQRRDLLTLGLARELEATVSTTLTSYLGIAHCFCLVFIFCLFYAPYG
uniref:HMG domain-containing protein n=1 Tax=Sander lucioperca TaxID=283035 RepID=A0A8C9Z7V2_SANLU